MTRSDRATGNTSTHSPVRGQGKNRLLAAAREVFAEKGFARAGVREIAARAGVAEPNVYWHFASKRGLFDAAVTEPFASFIQDFFGEWRGRLPGHRSALDEATDYLSGLYHVLHAERELLVAMLADRQFSNDEKVSGHLHSTVSELLQLHEQLLTPEITERGYRTVDVRIWTRIFFATIFTLAVHTDLLEAGGPIDPDTFIRELAEMAIRGALDSESVESLDDADHPASERITRVVST